MPEFAKHIEVVIKPDLSALRDLLASPAQEARWASAIADELEDAAREIRARPHASAPCTCDGVNSGCSHPACPNRGE